MLGENIYKLRKDKKLSQEQLAEQIGVSRQTISNWELNETSPNPDQLKLLSKTLNISIDKLLNNDYENILEEKLSNTEKLAGIIIKLLKILGILFIILLIIDIVAFILFASTKKITTEVNRVTTICEIEDEKYEIEFGTDKYFNCDNCPKKIKNEVKELVDYNDIDKSINNIEEYFESNNGICK